MVTFLIGLKKYLQQKKQNICYYKIYSFKPWTHVIKDLNAHDVKIIFVVGT